jgi:hypothetical protein
MVIRPETSEFIENLERHANRRLNYPQEVAELLDFARQSNAIDLFEDAIFHAKFIAKSYGVMKRIGVDGDGYYKLSAEFQSSLQKVTMVLKVVLQHAPAEIGARHEAAFFSVNQESLSRLMSLINDLALVKNWMLDGKPIP